MPAPVLAGAGLVAEWHPDTPQAGRDQYVEDVVGTNAMVLGTSSADTNEDFVRNSAPARLTVPAGGARGKVTMPVNGAVSVYLETMFRGGASDGMVVGVADASGTPVLGVMVSGNQPKCFRQHGGTYDQAYSGVDVSTGGAWHHLAGEFDSAAGKVRVYVDGVMKAELASTAAADGALVLFGIFDTAGDYRLPAGSEIGTTALHVGTLPTPTQRSANIAAMQAVYSPTPSVDLGSLTAAGAATTTGSLTVRNTLAVLLGSLTAAGVATASLLLGLRVPTTLFVSRFLSRTTYHGESVDDNA